MMKTFVRILVPLVLLLVAIPSYAICGLCQGNCQCGWQPGSGVNCQPDIDCCHVTPRICYSDGTDTPTPLESQYVIASVEVITIDATKAEPVRVAEQQPEPAEIALLTP
jgi:hypothetical protein